MSETKTLKAIQLALSCGDCRLWRNTQGEAWQGIAVERSSGYITLRHPRRINFGFANGASDLLGFKSITVTPDMVGQRLAVFASVEVKRVARFRKGQKAWLAMVKEYGGIAGVAYSVDEAQQLLK